MRNLSTKVKNMKISFLTLVEKKVTTSLQTLLPYFATIIFVGSFCKRRSEATKALLRINYCIGNI